MQEKKITDLEFTRLGPDDIFTIAELERLCFSTFWSEDKFSLEFYGDVFQAFGLKAEAELVAYCSFYKLSDTAEILNIAVHPAWREKGVAKKLLGLVLHIYKKLQVKSVILEVRITNEPARRLYAGFGFKQVGERKAYYSDTGEDALVLEIRL